MYDVCLILIKEQVVEKRSIVCTSTKHIANMLSITNSSMLMISVSENFLVKSECSFLQKYDLYLSGTIYLY